MNTLGGWSGGGPAVRLIEHILINSISPACNRPHGYLTVLVMVVLECAGLFGRACSSLLFSSLLFSSLASPAPVCYGARVQCSAVQCGALAERAARDR